MSAAQPTVEQLLDRTRELVDIPSESFQEAAIVAHLETVLRAVPHLRVDRVGDNLVARTELGRPERVILAGHTDTVPVNGNLPARRDGPWLWGAGTSDMKSGLAVMLELALALSAPTVDVTYVFYAREEVAGRYSGLEELFTERPELLEGDVAILGEPTSALIEAGCQGTMRAKITVAGTRAHTARPWTGENAIHRLAPILAALASYEERKPVIAGLQFREALQAVAIEGGVAGNVVPDSASVLVNHRFAPDRTVDQAFRAMRDHVAEFLCDRDSIELVECSAAAQPGTDQRLLRRLVSLTGGPVQPKLGWTDVARFSERGVPAVNFGPGDAQVAHRADEVVHADAIVATYRALDALLRGGA